MGRYMCPLKSLMISHVSFPRIQLSYRLNPF
jgi:hypothetical protein